ncbi:unnamed protein product [Effrenium voratum]|nr:unnamed protein product [Effrenium voratum]
MAMRPCAASTALAQAVFQLGVALAFGQLLPQDPGGRGTSQPDALVPALQWLLGLCETFPVRALEEINVAAAEGPISGVDCLALAPPRASWASRRMSGVSSALLVCVRATFVDVEELSVKPYKLQRSHSEPALCTQEDVGVESPEVMSMWKINTQQADPIDDQLDSRGNEGSLGHPEVCRRPCVHFAHPKRPPSLDKAWRRAASGS